MYTEEDLLPLSGLQHLAFCERRWALIHLEQQWEENLFTAEGKILHEKAHSAGIESRPEALVRRTLPLRSFRLGISGQADIVEFLPCEASEPGVPMPRRKGLWKPYPVEYKRTRDKHGSVAYRIQLCAQALCLEEMLQVPVPAGAVFDGKAKRREVVNFDEPLRQEVEHLAARMHQILQSGKTPRAIYAKKCEGCSMKPVCLPSVGESVSASSYLTRAVEANLRKVPGERASNEEEQPR
ncbi:MAG TPA: CRISPR-associated protein Cas4 [Edaphobacter sp.]|uniref:CRISPR-associated protein Cas4 n=1 Tax=Edaphobacter sp. TaxID=1934404 RepID=UPI002BFE2996|nr:CRISPR-associated protein Cas4 [Edaphobacter sp.]HUZ95876.1 CRISPR-associated protein Cas4 [Edaphobacter sp.]